jgi:arabinogalactan endo-1,4-beta-galactosidase
LQGFRPCSSIKAMKKSTLLMAGSAVALFGCAVVYISSSESGGLLELVKAGDASVSYTQLLDNSAAPSALTSTANTTAVSSTVRYTSWSFMGAKTNASGLCTLVTGDVSSSYIGNIGSSSDEWGLVGVSSIAVSYSGGDELSLYGAYAGDTAQSIGSYSLIYTFSNSGSATQIAYSPFRYFKFVNASGSDIAITNITVTYSCSSSTSTYISIADMYTGSHDVTVDSATSFTPTYSGTTNYNLTFYYPKSYSSYKRDIIVSGSAQSYTVEGLLANAWQVVTAYNSDGVCCAFNVTTSDEYYAHSDSSATAYYDDQSWASTSLSLTKNKISSSFTRGIDVSEAQYYEELGGKYYNASYKREDLYKLLKENGADTVRIRTWVNPYTTASTPVAYGGGICDTAHLLNMAKRANRVGLKVMVDFHLSDFWTHPSQSVLPKAWANYTTSTQVASAISTYVSGVMTSLSNVGVTPAIVQIGNEVSDGLYKSAPTSTGASTSVTTDANPNYITNAQAYASSDVVSGYLWNGSSTQRTNFRTYMAAGVAAVRAASSTTKIAVHFAGSFASSTTWMTEWYTSYITGTAYGTALDFDIVGFSYYPYYHGTIANVASAISNAKKNSVLKNKTFMCLETDYAYTTQYPYASNHYVNPSFPNDSYPSGSTTDYTSGYTVAQSSVAVQASFLNAELIQYVTSGVSGMFIWAGCWCPITTSAGVTNGWAGAGSTVTFANQSMFTYGGQILPTLKGIYAQ